MTNLAAAISTTASAELDAATLEIGLTPFSWPARSAPGPSANAIGLARTMRPTLRDVYVAPMFQRQVHKQQEQKNAAQRQPHRSHKTKEHGPEKEHFERSDVVTSLLWNSLTAARTAVADIRLSGNMSPAIPCGVRIAARSAPKPNGSQRRTACGQDLPDSIASPRRKRPRETAPQPSSHEGLTTQASR